MFLDNWSLLLQHTWLPKHELARRGLPTSTDASLTSKPLAKALSKVVKNIEAAQPKKLSVSSARLKKTLPGITASTQLPMISDTGGAMSFFSLNKPLDMQIDS